MPSFLYMPFFFSFFLTLGEVPLSEKNLEKTLNNTG